MAPLVQTLAGRSEFVSLCCLTGQHRQMLDSVMDAFALKADYDLNIMQAGQTLAEITTRILTGMEPVLNQVKPDMVLVHGDTSTAFAAALAAFYHKIPVGHVEAGLRTHKMYAPYPEEINRTLLADLATLHLAPTASCRENLRREGVAENVFVTGNTVIDALKITARKDFTFAEPVLREMDWENRRVLVLTCHRRENWGVPMKQIFTAVRRIVRDYPDVEVVYPVHPNPAVRECAQRLLGKQERVHLIEPLDVLQMHNLISRAYLVLTDSGGLQEEAPAFGKPVLVLRRETERPEAVTAGTVRLAGVETERIVQMTERLLLDAGEYASMARAVNPYGDGFACPRIANAICRYFGGEAEFTEFTR